MKKMHAFTTLINRVALISACLLPTSAFAQSVHLRMGNPSGATTSTSNSNNYLLDSSYFALSYSNSRRIPNWVSWQLNSSWLGSAPRQDNFRADTRLPSGWYRVVTSNYTNSGFDRGHMTPSADRTNTVTSNSETFLMTNIIPQAPDNNQGPWARLEDYERQLVSQGNELYIIAGGYGSCGTGSNGSRCTIGPSATPITVPDRVWKVIVVLPGTNRTAANVTTSTRVIAVDMPNDQGIRSNDWRSYRVSVDSIESRTGYNLLSNVSSLTQSTIESRVDTL